MQLPMVISAQKLHWLQGLGVGPFSQLRALAKYARCGRLSYASNSRKKISMRNAIRPNRIPQGSGDMLLPRDVVKTLRAPLTRQN